MGGNKNRKPEVERARVERIGHWRQRYPDLARSVDSGRRARKVGAEIDPFRHEEIFERDGWLCGICSEPVSQALAYPDPLSPSLDHVVPLSLGGSHTRENTRLAHLICNVRRGNRVGVPQEGIDQSAQEVTGGLSRSRSEAV